MFQADFNCYGTCHFNLTELIFIKGTSLETEKIRYKIFLGALLPNQAITSSDTPPIPLYSSQARA